MPIATNSNFFSLSFYHRSKQNKLDDLRRAYITSPLVGGYQHGALFGPVERKRNEMAHGGRIELQSEMPYLNLSSFAPRQMATLSMGRSNGLINQAVKTTCV